MSVRCDLVQCGVVAATLAALHAHHVEGHGAGGVAVLAQDVPVQTGVLPGKKGVGTLQESKVIQVSNNFDFQDQIQI